MIYSMKPQLLDKDLSLIKKMPLTLFSFKLSDNPANGGMASFTPGHSPSCTGVAELDQEETARRQLYLLCAIIDQLI